MTENTAVAAADFERDVTDDVSTMTSPTRRAVDFSISSLLGSHVDVACSKQEKHAAVKQLQLDSSPVDDSTLLLRHRLAAAALWYPWLHSVASLQSATSKHQLTHGESIISFCTELITYQVTCMIIKHGQ